MKKKSCSRIILYEWSGCAVIIAFLWIDEIFDIPHYFFHAPATPINWQESLFESILVLILAFMTVKFSENCLSEIKYLQEITVVCTLCKRQKKGDSWETDSETPENPIHGICPECLEKQHINDIPIP